MGRPRKNKATKASAGKENVGKTQDFNVSLDMSGNVYRGAGKTMYEALSNIPLDFMHVKTKGVISATFDGKTSDKLFYLKPLRLLFANKIRRAGFAKQLEALLK